MRIKVNVTTDVLERSKMCGFIKEYRSDSCAIAIAFIDLFENARVGHNEAWLITYLESSTMRKFDHKSRIELPQIASDFIKHFDSKTPEERVKMQPFSFEIEVPEYVISKIGLGEIYRVLSESKSLELVMHKETTI